MSDDRMMQLPQIVKIRTIDPGQFGALADLHEYAIRHAEKAFAKNGKAPFLWIVKARDTLVHIQGFWRNLEEKETASFIVGLFIRFIEAEAYASVVEAWMAVDKEPDFFGNLPDGYAVRNDPEREDVLVVQTASATGEERMTRWGVRYSDRTRPGFGRLLPRDDWPVDLKMQGRMALFASHEKPPEDILALMRDAFDSPIFGMTFQAKLRSLFKVMTRLVTESENEPVAKEMPN
jgi:hypothetical protein